MHTQNVKKSFHDINHNNKRLGRDLNPGQKLRRLLGCPLPYRGTFTLLILAHIHIKAKDGLALLFFDLVEVPDPAGALMADHARPDRGAG